LSPESITVPTEPALNEVFVRVKARRTVPIVAGAAVFLAVAAWTFLATPRYKSSALLRIASNPQTPALLDQLQSVPGLGLMGLGKDELETEVGVLKSRRIAESVLDSLALTVRMLRPKGVRDSIFSARVVSSADVDGKLSFVRESDGRYQVTAEKLTGATLSATSVAPGDTLRVGSVAITLSPLLKSEEVDHIEVQLLPRFKALKAIDDRLEIRQQEGGSRLVQVAFEDADRYLASRAVSRVVAEYVGYSNANENSDDRFRTGELRHTVDSVSRALNDAEERLRRFKETQKILVPDEQATQQLKRIAVLRTQLDGLEIEHSALEKMLTIVDARANNATDPAAYRQLATFPSLITNKAIQDYLATLADLENKRSELGIRRTPDNVEMRQFTTRISELETQLNQIGQQYLESLEQQITVATASVKNLTGDLDVFPRQEMEYVRLLRERTLANEAFIILEKQLKQTELTTAMRIDKVRVVDSAKVANIKDKEFPKTAVQLLLGAILGIAVALTLAFGRELIFGSDVQASVIASQKAGSDSAP
jgi:uncharacterized protein involved in exopolysaccharide biosynthesis